MSNSSKPQVLSDTELQTKAREIIDYNKFNLSDSEAKQAIIDLVNEQKIAHAEYQTYIYKQDHPNMEVWGIRVAHQGKQIIGDIAGSKEEAEARLAKHMAELSNSDEKRNV